VREKFRFRIDARCFDSRRCRDESSRELSDLNENQEKSYAKKLISAAMGLAFAFAGSSANAQVNLSAYADPEGSWTSRP
jgi:hypothetical protein